MDVLTEQKQKQKEVRRQGVHSSIDDLTDAVNNLITKIDQFMDHQSKSIPYPMVLLMFGIIIAALFGVKSLGDFMAHAAAGF